MGRIKSAIEIAMERTEEVKSDKGSIEQFNAKQKGKKLANAFLAVGADLQGEIKLTPAELRESFEQGAFDVLLSQIVLPAAKEDEKRLENVGKGLGFIIKDGRFAALYKQLMQALSQFLQDANQYEQAIRKQYAPKLRQKEEELSRRMGREVRIDPYQDPEFVAFYNQNMGALKERYEGAIAEC
ncbi:MAG: hypothetical protein LBU82_08175, partial [Treponema sp.]|nr:hypothetical protein [Treponema sp.]